MSNQKTAILLVFMILKTTLSFPLQYDKQLQNSSNAVVAHEPSFNKLSSNNEINSNLPTTNSTSAGGPRFSTYAIVGMGIGGALAVIGVLVLPAVLGFTAAGIAAGSAGAAMMSSTALASGGGVAAGSLVALLQSAGVLGVTASAGGIVATASAGTIGASVGYGLGYATENYFNPAAIYVSDAFNSARNETLIFLTGNGTNSWKSFSNWTQTNVDYAVFKIKNGTIDGWEKTKNGTVDAWNTLSDWTINNAEPVLIKLKNGTTKSWNSISNWTVVNSDILHNQIDDAWNRLSNWTIVNSENAMIILKNGTITTWNSFSDWVVANSKSISKEVKEGTVDAWNKVSNWTTSTVRSWTTSSAASSSASSCSKIILASLFYNVISTYIVHHDQTVLAQPLQLLYPHL